VGIGHLVPRRSRKGRAAPAGAWVGMGFRPWGAPGQREGELAVEESAGEGKMEEEEGRRGGGGGREASRLQHGYPKPQSLTAPRKRQLSLQAARV